VAKMLGVHKVTINRWIRDGKIRAVRIGKEYRIPEDEVKRLLGEKSHNTAVIYARVSRSFVWDEKPQEKGSCGVCQKSS